MGCFDHIYEHHPFRKFFKKYNIGVTGRMYQLKFHALTACTGTTDRGSDRKATNDRSRNVKNSSTHQDNNTRTATNDRSRNSANSSTHQDNSTRTDVLFRSSPVTLQCDPSLPVILFSKLNKSFLRHFHAEHINIDNKMKNWGEPSIRCIGFIKSTGGTK